MASLAGSGFVSLADFIEGQSNRRQSGWRRPSFAAQDIIKTRAVGTPENTSKYFEPKLDVVEGEDRLSVLDHNDQPIKDKDSLIESLCLEIGNLRVALHEKAIKESTLKEELTECRANLKSEFSRTSDLNAQVAALTEMQSAAGKQRDALQFEIQEKVEGNHAQLCEIRRLRGALSEAERKLEDTKISLEASAAENDELREKIRDNAGLLLAAAQQSNRIHGLEKSVQEDSGESKTAVEQSDKITELNSKILDLGSSLSDAILELEETEEALAICTAENKQLRDQATEHRHPISNGNDHSDQINHLWDCLNGRCEELDSLEEALTKSASDNETIRRKLEEVEQAQSKQFHKLRTAYLQKEREAECSQLTIRKLKRQNEYLRKQMKEKEEAEAAANRTISALHGIIAENKVSSLEGGIHVSEVLRKHTPEPFGIASLERKKSGDHFPKQTLVQDDYNCIMSVVERRRQISARIAKPHFLISSMGTAATSFSSLASSTSD